MESLFSFGGTVYLGKLGFNAWKPVPFLHSEECFSVQVSETIEPVFALIRARKQTVTVEVIRTETDWFVKVNGKEFAAIQGIEFTQDAQDGKTEFPVGNIAPYIKKLYRGMDMDRVFLDVTNKGICFSNGYSLAVSDGVLGAEGILSYRAQDNRIASTLLSVLSFPQFSVVQCTDCHFLFNEGGCVRLDPSCTYQWRTVLEAGMQGVKLLFDMGKEQRKELGAVCNAVKGSIRFGEGTITVGEEIIPTELKFEPVSFFSYQFANVLNAVGNSPFYMFQGGEEKPTVFAGVDMTFVLMPLS